MAPILWKTPKIGAFIFDTLNLLTFIKPDQQG